MREINEEKRASYRERVGLMKEPTDLKDASLDPGLQYQSNPLIKTKRDLEEKRKKELFEDL